MDIKVPEVGESITEAEIGEWLKQDGDYVQRDEVILTLETDKASVEVVAEASGQLTTKASEGDTVEIGAVIATLDTSAEAPAGASDGASEKPPSNGASESPANNGQEPMVASSQNGSKAPDSNHLSPAVRKAVNEQGLDPANIQGTGHY